MWEIDTEVDTITMVQHIQHTLHYMAKSTVCGHSLWLNGLQWNSVKTNHNEQTMTSG